ncbi:glycosyltransferase family A protein [Williamsia deligens]|nr:Glycosyl transferase family 2 [Williamsia deligens]
MPISVVAPAFNEEHTLPRCLHALMGQPTDVVVDIVVVDNNSVDDTVRVATEIAAQDDRVRIVHEERPGVAAARRAGFDAASSSIIAGVDADTIVEPGWAESIEEFFDRHPAVSGVSAPMVMRDLPLQGGYRRLHDRLVERAVRAGARGGTVSLPALTGANMALRATAWAGVRDHVTERQDLFDDLDLSLCLADDGSAIALAPGMSATVSGRRTLAPVPEFVRYALCVPRTYWCHHRHLAAILNAAVIPLGIVRHAVFLPIGRSWDSDAQRYVPARLFRRQRYRASPVKSALRRS